MSVQFVASDTCFAANPRKDGYRFSYTLSELLEIQIFAVSKVIKDIARAWLILINPRHGVARVICAWSGNAKNLIHIPRTLTFGENFYNESLKAAKHPTQATTKNSLDIGVNGFSSLSEGTHSYTACVKAHIVFSGTAAQLSKATLFHKFTGGVASLLGTLKSSIVLEEGSRHLKLLEEEAKSLSTPSLENKIKIQKVSLRSERFTAFKNINATAFGAIALISLLLPSVAIPATIIGLLTSCTIIETVAKSFFDQKIKKEERIQTIGNRIHLKSLYIHQDDRSIASI